MIDIHHHCLPGVDDGPRDWHEAVDLCQAAKAAGIETIIATPHVLRGRWNPTPADTLHGLADTLAAKIGHAPQLVLGSECFFDHDVSGALRAGTVIPLARSRYVLIEFASHNVPPMIAQAFYQLQLDGWIPVIAHPERNAIFQARPDLLASLIRSGAKTQITTGSFTGAFGGKAEKAAHAWLRQEWVHFAATDAHNTAHRPPIVAEAVRVITQIAGEKVLQSITVDNPRAVLEGKALPYDPEPRAPENAGFLRGLGRWLRGRQPDGKNAP